MKKIISMLLAAVMCFSLITVSFAAEMNFTDVKSSDWFYSDVKSAVEMGLVNGKSATTYAPNDNLTYAEAIKLAACMNMIYTQGEINIKAGSPWYKPYVDYCVEYNIIDREYDYTSNATRAGYMGIFAKALPEEGFGVINNVPDDSIPDVPSKASYAPGIYKLYRAGILTGVDAAHNCNPLANITRAEVAAILTRIMNESKRVSITDMAKEEVKEEEKKEEVKEEEKEETKVEEEKKEETKEEEKTEPLKIKSQPEDTLLTIGVGGKFKVEVTGGKTPYKYQWKADDSGSGMYSTITTGEMFDKATTDELHAYPTSSKQKIDVICIIMDANGDTITTDKFTITAKAAPLKITEQPKDIEDASYENRNDVWCNVTGGEGDRTYTWEYDLDGVWLPIDRSMKEFTPSANGLNYAPQKAGTYKVRCVITAGEETVTTDAATITAKEIVDDTPELKITKQPQNVTVQMDELAEVSVAVEGGKAPYTYKWYRKIDGGTPMLVTSSVDNSHTTANLKVKTSVSYWQKKYEFSCKIIDSEGREVTSDYAIIAAN